MSRKVVNIAKCSTCGKVFKYSNNNLCQCGEMHCDGCLDTFEVSDLSEKKLCHSCVSSMYEELEDNKHMLYPSLY